MESIRRRCLAKAIDWNGIAERMTVHLAECVKAHREAGRVPVLDGITFFASAEAIPGTGFAPGDAWIGVDVPGVPPGSDKATTTLRDAEARLKLATTAAREAAARAQVLATRVAKLENELAAAKSSAEAESGER